MPEIRYFTVTQTREVVVAANSSLDAILIAKAGFENGQNSDNGVIDGPAGIWGNTDTKIRETKLDCVARR